MAERRTQKGPVFNIFQSFCWVLINLYVLLPQTSESKRPPESSDPPKVTSKIDKIVANKSWMSFLCKSYNWVEITLYRFIDQLSVEKCWDTKTFNLSRNLNKFVAWQVVSSMKNEQQSQTSVLLELKVAKSRPALYSFHYNFFQPATNIFLARDKRISIT